MQHNPDKPSQEAAWLERLRLHTANPNAVVTLTVLAAIVGALAGLSIVLLRLFIEYSQQALDLLMKNHASNQWEELLARFLLPVTGAVILGAVFHFLRKEYRSVGTLHVIERLQFHQGHMPFINTIVQFFGTTIAIVSGHSVGREGPGMHIGASAGSFLASRLKLPKNSMHTLAVSGTAAAIAASFNTPLAGVILVLEVMVREYRMITFVPVIAASVAGTAVSIAVFGNQPAFTVPTLELASMWELPVILAMGIFIGAASALFSSTTLYTVNRSANWPIFAKFLAAGVVTGLIAMAVPQIMGVGYSTVSQAMFGELTLFILLTALLGKVLATSTAVGFGIPGGLVSPLVFMGAVAGGTFAVFVSMVVPELGNHIHGFYAMIGIGAMLAAAIQAPLAALVLVLEMTNNVELILPVMLAIVTATLTSRSLFKQQPIYRELLNARGMTMETSAISQRLRSIGVSSAMSDSFAQVPSISSTSATSLALEKKPEWVVVMEQIEGKNRFTMMPAVDVIRAIEESENDEVRFNDIPAKRVNTVTINQLASLQEAIGKLDKKQADAVLIQRFDGGRVTGVLTRRAIEMSYK